VEAGEGWGVCKDVPVKRVKKEGFLLRLWGEVFSGATRGERKGGSATEGARIVEKRGFRRGDYRRKDP